MACRCALPVRCGAGNGKHVGGGGLDPAGLAGLSDDVAALALALRDGVPSEDVVASVRGLYALDAKPMNCGIRCNPADDACCKSSNMC